MVKIKYLVASGATSAALVFGLAAAPALAANQTVVGGDNNSQSQSTTDVSDSPTNNGGTQANNGGTALSANGNCSVAAVTEIEQSQHNSSDQSNDNDSSQVGVNVNGQGIDGSNSQSNSSSNSNSQSNSVSNTENSNGPTISPNCSTTNVTNVSQASSSTSSSSARSAAQVSSLPSGGVSAGQGAVVTSSASVLGLFGSLATTGLGLGLRFLKRGAFLIK